MKKLASIVLVATLTLGSLFGCKPLAGPPKSAGASVGSVGLSDGVDAKAIIQALQQNQFERIEGKTFEQVLPRDTQSRGYEGLDAFRDTTAKKPNEFIVGVGPDTVTWFTSHDVAGDKLAGWESHLQKRIALIERLAAKSE